MPPLHSDWFRIQTADDSLQPTIDMLLNLSVFLYFGAVCPWPSFADSASIIPLYRLILLGLLILLLRRIPIILVMHQYIWQIQNIQQALFMGFFGPIGVSSIFYLYISLDFLNHVYVDDDGGEGKQVVREDVEELKQVFKVVVWFLAICSIVIHGLSVPVGKLGYHLPTVISRAETQSRAPSTRGESAGHELDEVIQVP